MTPEEIINLAYEAAKGAASEDMDVIVGVGHCVDLAVNVYGVGKDAHAHLYPSKEEQARIRESEKQLALVKIRKALRECLVRNRTSTEVGSLGVPTVCEKTAFIFGLMGAQDEVDKMKAIFNEFNKLS